MLIKLPFEAVVSVGKLKPIRIVDESISHVLVNFVDSLLHKCRSFLAHHIEEEELKMAFLS